MLLHPEDLYVPSRSCITVLSVEAEVMASVLNSHRLALMNTRLENRLGAMDRDIDVAICAEIAVVEEMLVRLKPGDCAPACADTMTALPGPRGQCMASPRPARRKRSGTQVSPR